ncbi:MAG: hypothetical protein LQ337_000702 [Flavoplaca oasis]|nr:MAG: hypothetical protein LQ337_000702 [Flavoplaca oasis]
MPPKELYFITGNNNKLAEVKAILEDVVPLRSRSLEQVEIQGTTEDISKDKCRRAADLVGGPVLVEDTCLAFTALKGLPGPYIKWFLQALGHDGLNNLLAGYENKSAEAICTFAYCAGPGNEPLIFQGRVSGKIVPARGSLDFGWDPIFEYMGETFAEMDKVKKNGLSHRFLALSKLKDWLKQS